MTARRRTKAACSRCRRAAAQEACSKQDLENSGGTITIDSECKFGEAITTSHAVVTGSFDSMANGMTMNVLDLQKMRGAPKQP